MLLRGAIRVVEELAGCYSVIAQRSDVFLYGHENWLTFEILDSAGVRHTYEVFFNLTRQSSKFVRIYVESGYVRTADDEMRRPSDFRRQAKMRGKVLLAKKLRKPPILAPRGR